MMHRQSTLVINLINITSDTIMAKEGIGTVRMKLGEEHITNYYQRESIRCNRLYS